MKVALIIIGFVILLGIGVFFFLRGQLGDEMSVILSPYPYRNQEFGFEFQYPDDLRRDEIRTRTISLSAETAQTVATFTDKGPKELVVSIVQDTQAAFVLKDYSKNVSFTFNTSSKTWTSSVATAPLPETVTVAGTSAYIYRAYDLEANWTSLIIPHPTLDAIIIIEYLELGTIEYPDIQPIISSFVFTN